MAVIDYYFVGISPYVYLGHRALVDMAKRHGATVNYKPVTLKRLWAKSGSTPLADRPPVRRRYRFLELQRHAEARGLPLNLQPKHFPVDASLAELSVIAIVEQGGDPVDFMERVFSGVWVEDADVSDRDTVAGYLTATGFDAEAILEQAGSDEALALRDRYSREAVEADAIGVPAYVLNGEVFWGQDRIDLLESAIVTGREPYGQP
ncbi:MAG: 2-hydroxychromene-2-carboxylate isomerase [Rhizobiaceae bacterium MnEN-MB40S]|nr:MAG: 2-hydroxychromene-2-carboxylate isomerase [Rhizobiaceae bacterium MnEN-MB40S]